MEESCAADRDIPPSRESSLYSCPSVRSPTAAQVRSIAKDFGFEYEEDTIQEYKSIIGESIDCINGIEDLVEPRLPTRHPRLPGHKPERKDNPYNAWMWRCDVQGASTGKLAGKQVAIKDNIAVAGVPMTNGCNAFQGYTPDFDASVVTRILDTGGCIAGKTVCENMCWSGTSYTSATGPVRNPFDPTRSVGGSSSGSAVAVLTGDVDMALGCDQGGSIRMPASWTGIVGLKPTFGLVPYTGILGAELSVDHVGPMARTVVECAQLLEVIAGYDSGLDPRQFPHTAVHEYTKLLEDGNLSGLKLGILKEGFEAPDADPEVNELVRETAERLRELGADVREVSVPLHTRALGIWTSISEGVLHTVVHHGGIGTGHNGYYPSGFVVESGKVLASRPNDISDHVKLMLIKSEYLRRQYRGQVYARGRNLTFLLRAAYDRVFEDVDVLVMPTIPFTSTKLLTKDEPLSEYHKRASEVSTNTRPFNLTGHPAVTVNAGFVHDLPVGVMFVGRQFEDAIILKAARGVEKVREISDDIARKIDSFMRT